MEKYNFTTKFKERTPAESIKAFRDFFESRGFNIEIAVNPSEIGTYATVVDLYYNGIKVRQAYGKGVTEEFATASGLGELYEDMCNFVTYTSNYLFSKKYRELSKQERGYYIEPTEKILTHEEVLSHPYIYKELVENMWDGDIQKANKFIDMITDDIIIGEEYTNVITGEKSYFDKRISFFVEGSNGSAGGNDYYEAFNQGFSEILERMVQAPFFVNKDFKHKVLTKKGIGNPKLISLVEKVEALGNKVYVIDCSYIFNTPVMGVMIIDLTNHRTVLDFGCFPVFDIALERCLTEIYQGTSHLHHSMVGDLQVPYKSIDPAQRVTTHFTVKTERFLCCQMEFFDNCEYVDSPNWNVFLKDEDKVNNIQIYNYYINLIKATGWTVFARNMSYCDNLAAVHIVFNDFKIIGSRKHFFNFKEINWNALETIYKMAKDIADIMISKDNYSYKKINELMNREYLKYYPVETELVSYIIMPTGPTGVLGDFDYFKSTQNDDICDVVLNGFDLLRQDHGFEYQNVVKYTLLNRYKKCGEYSKEEIRHALDLLGIQFTDEDYENSNDKDYILEHIFILPNRNLYLSEDYNNLIRALYIKREDLI